jgi:hypothetical protein
MIATNILGVNYFRHRFGISIVRTILDKQETAASAISHCSAAYSASACLRIGMSGSASFQAVRKSRYAARALAVSPSNAQACQAETRERTDGFVENDPSMVEDFLKLRSGFLALMRGQTGFATHKGGIQGVPSVSSRSRRS